MRKISIIIVLSLFLLVFPLQTVKAANPVIGDVFPSNGATGVVIQNATTDKYVTIRVNLSDSDGDLNFYALQVNTNGSWQTVDYYVFPDGVSNFSLVRNISNCSYNTTVYWSLSVRDNASGWTNATYYFITEMEPSGGEGGTSTGDITLFPATPISGKLFAVIISNPVDAYGYLWIQNNIYPLTITKGFGTVETPEEVYGSATIWLYGGKTKTFDIDCGLTGLLSLVVPDSVVVDSSADIQIKMGGALVGMAEVYVTDPSGATTSVNTTTGTISQIFDKVGDWHVEASLNGQSKIQEVQVTYKPIDLSTDDTQYKSGDDVTINTEDNALVSISVNGVIKVQSMATNGVVMYTPRDPGKYEVTATLGDKQSTEDFNVYQDVRIQIVDTDTNAQVVSLKANKNYAVKLVDSRDQIIYDFSAVQTTDSSTPSITLNNGIGFWTPKQGGIVTLSIDEKQGYTNTPLTVTVEGMAGETNILVPVVIGIIIVIVILLLYFFRSKLPSGIREKFKLKPKREIPI